jgi:pimeloyl-ACP methyl ester carboxylesterase
MSLWKIDEPDDRLGAVPPLVFLPGAGGSASFWRPVADRLADLGQVHVFGYPGFGGLPADPGIKSLDDLFAWLVERLPPGTSHVIAQSMGGVLAARLALERPERVARLVLVATSGGVDAARLGAAEWRHDYRALQPDVSTWFIDDQTDLTNRLAEIRARTLLLWSDADPISPPSVARLLAGRIPGARIVTVAGGTHSFASERAEEVASIIRSHLA